MYFHFYIAVQMQFCIVQTICCFLQDYCVKELCFVCVSLHRCFMEVWMHAYIQIGMLDNILLCHFSA